MSNDKQSWGILAEYRPTLSGEVLPSFTATYAQTEVPHFKAQETRQYQLGASVLWKNPRNDRQFVLASYQYAQDKALAPLETYDPSKVTQGFRVFAQTDGPQRMDFLWRLDGRCGTTAPVSGVASKTSNGAKTP